MKTISSVVALIAQNEMAISFARELRRCCHVIVVNSDSEFAEIEAVFRKVSVLIVRPLCQTSGEWKPIPKRGPS
jgi:hypothetical protein